MRHRAERLASSRAAQAVLDPEATFRPQIRNTSSVVLREARHAADPWRRVTVAQPCDRKCHAYSCVDATSDARENCAQRRALSIWEVQFAEAEQRRAERRLLQQLYELDERRQCSYRPYICDASRAIDREARGRSASATCRSVRGGDALDGVERQVTKGNERSGSAPPMRVRMEARRDGMAIHDSLFADAKEKRRMQMQRQAMHETELAAMSRSLSAKRLRPESLHRLCYAHHQKTVELEALRDYLNHHEDLTTCRPLFRPRITRGPTAPSTGSRLVPQPLHGAKDGGKSEATAEGEMATAGDESSLATGAQLEGAFATNGEAAAEDDEVSASVQGTIPVKAASRDNESKENVGLLAHMRGDTRLITGEAFHTARVKQRRSREALRKEHMQQISADARRPTTGAFTLSSISAKLVETMRERRLEELFAYIDANHGGLVEGKVLLASLPSLPQDIANALRPCSHIFKSRTYTLPEFKTLVIHALRTIPPNGPRVSLMPDRGRVSTQSSMQANSLREQQTGCSFRPQLDPHSERLAARRRDISRPICEQLMQQHANYSARRLAAQQKAMSEAAELCTFRPTLTAHTRCRTKVFAHVPVGCSRDAGAGTLPGTCKCPRQMSSEDIELERHCSFKPRINTFPGVSARADAAVRQHKKDLTEAFQQEHSVASIYSLDVGLVPSGRDYGALHSHISHSPASLESKGDDSSCSRDGGSGTIRDPGSEEEGAPCERAASEYPGWGVYHHPTMGCTTSLCD